MKNRTLERDIRAWLVFVTLKDFRILFVLFSFLYLDICALKVEVTTDFTRNFPEKSQDMLTQLVEKTATLVKIA